MPTLIVQPKNQKQLAAIEAVLRALDISFKKEEESPYNPEFVAEIEKRRRQIKEGSFVTVDPKKTNFVEQYEWEPCN